jgi:DNA-directed RNA polymerase subunit RPC12/RpoP
MEFESQQNLKDQTLVCIDCNEPFHFSIGEQLYFKAKQLSTPKRCPRCRRRRRLTINPDRTQSLDDFDAVMDKAKREIKKEVSNG